MKRLVLLHFIIITFLHCALCLIPCRMYGQSSFKCRLDSIWVTSTHMHERYVFTYDEQGHCLSEDYEEYEEYRDHVRTLTKKTKFEYDSLGRNVKVDFERSWDNRQGDREILERIYDNQGGWIQNEYHYSYFYHEYQLNRVTYPKYGDKMMTLYEIDLRVNPANVFKEEYYYADSAMNIPVKMREYYLNKDSIVWIFRYERDYPKEKEQQNNSEKAKFDSLGNITSNQIFLGEANVLTYDTSTPRHQVMGLHYEPNDMLNGYFTNPYLLKLCAEVQSKIIESNGSKYIDEYHDNDKFTTYFYTELQCE